MGGKQCGLTTWGDQDVVIGRGHTGAFGKASGHGLAHLLGAGHHGVSGVTAAGGLVHCGEDHWIGANVVLADGQFGHVDALGNHPPGFVKHVPAV